MDSTKKKTSPIVAVIVILVIGLIGYMIYAGSRSNNGQKTDVSKASNVVDDRDLITEKYRTTYCKNRANTKVSSMPEGYPINDGSGWTDDECKIIISKILDSTFYSDSTNIDEEIKRVTEGKYWIGMSETALLYSIGSPRDVNTTKTDSYTKKQYVYGSITNPTYIYTENGKVTTIQD